MIWAQVLWATMGLGVVVYAITGGADLGAGLWSALASGPRKAEQRRAVMDAIAPIWEANHVWLIFVIVVMFSAFSRGFAALCIALHIPIALALVGIVLRGAAYVFHAYGIQSQFSKDQWSQLFAWSSGFTPLVLGTVVGGVSTSQIRWNDGQVLTGYLAGWTTPFALLVGVFSLSLFALLSAAYLAADTRGELSDDFRRRALVAEWVAGGLALVVFLRAAHDAPDLYENLSRSPWTWPIQIGTAAAALGAVWCLQTRRVRLARFAVAAQVSLVVVGWGAAMDQHFILPDLTLARATNNLAVLPAITLVLALGMALLAPALWFLYHVFKRPSAEDTSSHD